MTDTLENTDTTRLHALETAGVGGVISRGSVNYTVSKDAEDNWLMSADGGPTEPAITYVEDGWSVVSLGEKATPDMHDECGNCGETYGVHRVGTGSCPDGVTTWVTVTLEEEVQPETVYGFFQGMSMYTYVRSTYDNYIFLGFDNNTDGDTVVSLVHQRYMEVIKLDVDAMAEVNYYTVVQDGDIPKVASQDLRRALRQLATRTNELEARNAICSNLSEQHQKLMQDYVTVNEHINAYADEMSMCPDYERRIFSWNDGVNGQPELTNKLYGRRKQHTVYLQIPGLLPGVEMYTYVEARSPEEAKAAVVGMSGEYLLRKVLEERNFHFRDLEVNVTNARL